jgi:folate-binding Fe-S cluster repair protein YgfZ
VSFTKGCFVGQELVCRIDTRGHVNRYLRHLVPDDATTELPAGAEVVAGEKVVGKVTSAAPGIALGFVRREVDPGSVVNVDGREVTVRELHR